MKIKFLGTAAYEGVPALFCNCRVCKLSREVGGRNIRSRSQALVNDELLIDFNADTVMHYQKYLFDWNKISDCLITHAHCDHLYIDDVEIAAEGYSHDHGPINFYVGKDGYEKLKPICDKTHGGATVVLVGAGDRFVTTSGYAVTAMRADHVQDMDCLIYAVEKDGKRLLYAHDSGYFYEQTWKMLKAVGRFDLVSLDCTGCLGLGGQWRQSHMSLGTDLEAVERMKSLGIVDGKTVVVVNHFSHNGGQTHDEMCEQAEKRGVVVAYDGLEIIF